MKSQIPNPDTTSVCPECLARIDARYVRSGQDVYLAKTCPEHGAFEAVIWRGTPDFDAWCRPKIPGRPVFAAQATVHGCPLDCGLCPDHLQRTCTAVIDITGRCNLDCPYCFADASPTGTDLSLDQIDRILASVRRSAGLCNIQLSGGEPSLHPDLPAIVNQVRRHGFTFVQLNTNGLALGRDPGFTRTLKRAGLDSIFLQFDGPSDAIYRRLRGRPLLAAKLAAIEACAEAGIGVVLVPTLVPGVNTSDVGAILEFAAARVPVVRGVHFQPVSYFGRCPAEPDDGDRVTLPEVIRAVETQSGGRFPASAFHPPGCEHARCSFSGQFLVLEGARILALSRRGSSCCAPASAEAGAGQAIAYVARQWKAAPDGMAADVGTSAQQRPLSLDAFCERARTHLLSVSAMAFQDVWNLDLERLRGCCIHAAHPDGRLIPFCAYNLTGRDGRRFYRP